MSEQQFGRYVLKTLLGRGGMGMVHLAYDTNRQHDVALKMLPVELFLQPEAREQFIREAFIIMQLEHHGIVPVYDVGQHEGFLYMAMRLMRGGSLANKLGPGPLSMEDTNSVMQIICDALNYAHARGVIHRDLKPGNILFDESGRAYLADFGLARLAGATSQMTMAGTPNYMSPEQIQGANQDIRTDVYLMGAVLYEMLTGQPPFIGDSLSAVIQQHLNAPVPLASHKNKKTPIACNQVIQKAMAKEKMQRYQTTSELAAAFSSALRQPRRKEPSPPPVQAFSPPIQPQMPVVIQAAPPKAGGSNKWKVNLTLVLLAAGLIWFGSQNSSAPGFILGGITIITILLLLVNIRFAFKVATCLLWAIALLIGLFILIGIFGGR